MKRTFFLLALIPLLLPLLTPLLTRSGAAAGQSPANWVAHRYVTLSGSSADSTNYSVVTVVGQPVTSITESSSFKVTGGFLHAQHQEQKTEHNIWLPIIAK